MHVIAALVTGLAACHSHKHGTAQDTSAVDSDTAADTDVPAGDTSTTEEDTGMIPRAPLQFQLPVKAPELFDARLGVDHDPAEYSGIETYICLDYAERPFPHCYDTHTGTDLILDGGFTAMDSGSAQIVAAAAGLVVDTEDGHYDRCHGSLETGGNDCDGHPMIANSVTIEHETGHKTLYLHMMKDSVAVSVGDTVEMGTVLGYVGSSGNSAMPHLHFELVDALDVVLDPFAGPLSQEETWWCDQGGLDDLPGTCD